MKNYTEFRFIGIKEIEQETLIAFLLEQGFEAFEQLEDSLVSYLPSHQITAQQRNLLLQLPTQFNGLQIEEKKLAAQNWNASWESDYPVVQVDDFCVIRADFHPPADGVEYEILIVPQMTFGTGHHATTFMMLQAMRPIDFLNKKVLDFGCGTAVLAIMAEKLGAKRVVAIDNDPWAYENSLENIQKNSILDRYEVILGDWSTVPDTFNYDVILANINRNIILMHLEAMVQLMSEGAFLLCSGFLEEDIDLILHAAKKQQLTLISRVDKEEWRCLIFRK